MDKIYTALGLMSGTSMDGVDASIIKTDCATLFEPILDRYYKYDDHLHSKLTSLRDKINTLSDLEGFSNEINLLEKEITIFHAKVVKKILDETDIKINFLGFHGQTIYHNPDCKVSRQLGDGKLLSQLTKKEVVYNFRQNDIQNGGQGAPLTPIFHSMLAHKFNLAPSVILNIGGIINTTTVLETGQFIATDIGPGMCLIDKWIRLNSKHKYDKDGDIAALGKINDNLKYELDIFYNSEKKDLKKNYIKSFDISDFDISFVRGLSLEDGAATLTEYTVQIIFHYFLYIVELAKNNNNNCPVIILCGGGRKNNFLVKRLNREIKKNFIGYNFVKMIDDYGIDGDFVESQAFAYLAISSYLGLPITFPNTTGCKEPITGGVIVKNF
ncbi:anhydro-N-acetylmuramic acid kinase [Candidatus Pelagibacter sp.]|jgi:anhydro-N-acetylmuramic acid kinase|nr:anhydro-N-acetylmuramic acid kinase [Candidatus Pelagibacter sp.]